MIHTPISAVLMKKEKQVATTKNKERKHLPKWANLTLTIGICLSCCGLGVGVGLILNHFLSFESVDYSGLDINDYEDDVTKLISKYNKTDSNKYLTTFAPHELACIARYKAAQHQNVKYIGIGQVNAAMGIKQSVRGYYLKHGNDYFFESISKSKLVGINKRFYQGADKVTIYYGSGSDPEKAKWDENDREDFTIEDFTDIWGKDLSRASAFIISSKTIIADESSATKDGNEIFLSLELDPLTSVLRYVKQMKAMSDLDDYPTFHKMHIDMKLDEDLNLLWNKTYETYDVKSFGVTSKNTTGGMDETFYYDVTEGFNIISFICFIPEKI